MRDRGARQRVAKDIFAVLQVHRADDRARHLVHRLVPKGMRFVRRQREVGVVHERVRDGEVDRAHELGHRLPGSRRRHHRCRDLRVRATAHVGHRLQLRALGVRYWGDGDDVNRHTASRHVEELQGFRGWILAAGVAFTATDNQDRDGVAALGVKADQSGGLRAEVVEHVVDGRIDHRELVAAGGQEGIPWRRLRCSVC